MTGRWAKGYFNTEISRRYFIKAAGTAVIIAAAGTFGCAGSRSTAGPTPFPTRAQQMASGKLIVAEDAVPVQGRERVHQVREVPPRLPDGSHIRGTAVGCGRMHQMPRVRESLPQGRN